jgi:hypothetical protein
VGLAAWWLGGLVAVTGIGLLAVGSVGDGISGGSPGALSPADLSAGTRTAAAPPTTASPLPRPTRTSAPATASPTTAPPVAVRSTSLSVTGGTVRFSCRGSTLSVDFATPRVGFAVELHDRTRSSVRVEFQSDTHESRVSAACSGGAPVVSAEERADHSGGGD